MSKTFGIVGGGGGGIKLVSIAITIPPKKTTYKIGETFDPTGMVVTATYSNGATLAATGYAYSPDGPLTLGDNTITVRYTEGGISKTVTQEITVEKLQGTLSLDKTSVSLDLDTTSDVVTATTNSTGAITASSSNEDVATVSVSGNVITITGVANGNAVITVNVAEDDTYVAPPSQTCAVSVSFAAPFADTSWSDIIAACKNNNVPDIWVVGDSKIMTIDTVDYQIDIIGKNHDEYADGSGTAPLTFQMHECYGTRYPMDIKSDAYNQWQNSTMRTRTLLALLNKMPSEIQAAIKEISKQTGKGSLGGLITTSETLFLLSAAEVFGEEEATSTAAAGEGTQYEYYAAGNSKIKNLSGTAAGWWLRSPVASNLAEYHFVRATGVLYYAAINGNSGVAFAFCF